MCVADFLNERFETPLLVEALAAPAVASTWAGPWSAGTDTNLLLRECAGGEAVAGGPPALVAALLARGARRRRRDPHRRRGRRASALENGGAVAGVTLASGETIDAPMVLATGDPEAHVARAAARRARCRSASRRSSAASACRGTAAKVHLALSGPLELAGRPTAGSTRRSASAAATSTTSSAPSTPSSTGASPTRPHLEIRVPTVADPSLAPAGHHVVSILASFAPYDLDGGWTDGSAASAWATPCSRRLERHAPDVRAADRRPASC